MQRRRLRRACAGAALAALCASGAFADGLVLPKTLTRSKSSRNLLLSQQLAVLDTRAAQEYSASARLTPRGQGGGATVLPGYNGRYRGAFMETARAAARRYGIPEDLFLRLVQHESGWNSGAVSPKGATGLAQLMPETADRLGVDETNPHENLEGGARYLRMMYDRFGDWRLALAAYNAGPEAVEKYGGVPPYAETTAYVRAISGS
ncbi:MAG: lytic transglycosylase domain-containing protein [Proteobacteria bacterium]|nr:lytic transglycosylase domain-containing protein [Pseudomonadota bacterium]MBS0573703.1 lytic transglycosylase domain-containing protein [Pseudomonadota bacterium]